MSQKAFADKLGYDRSYYSRIENYKRPCDLELLSLAAEVLKTTPTALQLRRPDEPRTLWEIYDSLNEDDQATATRLVAALQSKAG